MQQTPPTSALHALLCLSTQLRDGAPPGGDDSALTAVVRTWRNATAVPASAIGRTMCCTHLRWPDRKPAPRPEILAAVLEDADEALARQEQLVREGAEALERCKTMRAEIGAALGDDDAARALKRAKRGK